MGWEVIGRTPLEVRGQVHLGVTLETWGLYVSRTYKIINLVAVAQPEVTHKAPSNAPLKRIGDKWCCYEFI